MPCGVGPCSDSVSRRLCAGCGEGVEAPLGRLVRDNGGVEVVFIGEVWPWRGPSPFHFVTVPQRESDELRRLADLVSYGWGMLPVRVVVVRTDAGDGAAAAQRSHGTEWTTSLYPKDGGYALPLKAAVRRAEGIELGDTVTIHLEVGGLD